MDWSFNELELAQAYRWPIAAKTILFMMLLALLYLLGHYVLLAEQWTLLRQAQQQSAILTPIVAHKKALADSLTVYEQQAEHAALQEYRLLQQVPTSRETANTLHNISTLAQQHSLKLVSIQWEKEQFLSQLNAGEMPSKVSNAAPDNTGPIKLTLRIHTQGAYHQLGHFVAKLSALPRIVLIDQLVLTRPNTQKQAAPLNMELVASTYTYPVQEAADSL